MKKIYPNAKSEPVTESFNPAFVTQLTKIQQGRGVEYRIDDNGDLQLAVKVERMDQFEGPIFNQDFLDHLRHNNVSSTAINNATEAVYDAIAEVAVLEALLLASRRS